MNNVNDFIIKDGVLKSIFRCTGLNEIHIPNGVISIGRDPYDSTYGLRSAIQRSP